MKRTPAGLILPGLFLVDRWQRLLFRLPISAARERRSGWRSRAALVLKSWRS